MAPRLRRQLGLVHESAYVTTVGLNGQVMAHTCESRKTAFTVRYMQHLSPVEESELLVVPIWAYDIALGMHWVQSRKPDVDWHHCRLLALRTPVGAEVVAVNRVLHQEYSENIPRSAATQEACSEAGGGIAAFQILRATALNNQLGSEQVVGTFFQSVGDCTELLGATFQCFTDGE
jgi:hypothetical protein